MAISSTITAALTSIQAQVAAAEPLANAPHATIVALQLNAANLVASIQRALTAPSILDTYVAPPDPVVIISGVLQLSTAATDEANLSLMRGVTGRAASNLDQLV
jgi:hypothetical protein